MNFLLISIAIIVLVLLIVGVVLFLHKRSFNKNKQYQQEVVSFLQDSLYEKIDNNNDQMRRDLGFFKDSMINQLMQITKFNEDKLEKIREVMHQRLVSLQNENSLKIDQMRQVVDEKLQVTLERRLGQSFKVVSERLTQVHKGLGEMCNLASDVGDLKRVLTNVKTRGTWAEVQLGSILEQILPQTQYQRNVATKAEGRERVEFAVKIPVSQEHTVWLPIDAKFPKEDYERLVDAYQAGNKKAISKIRKSLFNRIKLEAKNIKEKYINPPATTDLAILFLGTEGLYAEVLRKPDLMEFIQREYRVVVVGPTTMAALINIVQTGARAFAIEKRAREVWELLEKIKKEFGKFGGILDKVQRKLSEANKTVEDATRKTRTIERRLNSVGDIQEAERLRAPDDRDQGKDVS
jgi:DNA recombination protein RmuC